MRKAALCLLLAVCGWGAYRHWLREGLTPLTAEGFHNTLSGAGRVHNPRTLLPIQGRSTVFIFHDGIAGESGRLLLALEEFRDYRPDVVVQLIRLNAAEPAAFEPWQRAYDIRSLPHLLIYDDLGVLIAADRAGSGQAIETFWRWLDQERVEHAWREGA